MTLDINELERLHAEATQTVEDMAWEAARRIVLQYVDWGMMSPQNAEHFRGRGLGSNEQYSFSAEIIAETIRRALRRPPSDRPDYTGLGSGRALEDARQLYEQPPFPTPAEAAYDKAKG